MDIQPGFDPIDSSYVGFPLGTDERWYDMRTEAERQRDLAAIDDLIGPDATHTDWQNYCYDV